MNTGPRKRIRIIAVMVAAAMLIACGKSKSTPATQQPPAPNPGTLSFSTMFSTVAENDANATITVNRTGGTLGAVSIDYASSDGTAIAGTHYTAASGTLTWLDGESIAKTFTVSLAADDRTTEPDRTIALSLSGNTGGATLGASAATLTILDDDNSGVLGFSQLSLAVNESAGSATINVSRTGGDLGAVSVTCATATSGTAMAGADYTATSAVLNWTDTDSAPKSCTVPITDDPDAELAETIQLVLSGPAGGATLGGASATITINLNDTPTASYLFYSASLHAVDPGSFASSITVDSNARSAELVPHGLWDSANDLIRDLHARSVVFESGGKLFRAGARVRDGEPGNISNAAMQVSNESGLGAGVKAVCDMRTFTDYADHTNARFAWQLAGADGNCDTGDDSTRAAALGATASDAPIVLDAGKSVVAALRDATSGAITGWLLYDAGSNRLESADMDFTGITTLKTAVNDHAVRLVATTTHVFLDLDGSLHVYVVASETLSSLYTGTPSAPLSAIADPNDLYFLATGTGVIYQVPLDASSASTRRTVVDEGSNVIIAPKIELTNGRVVYVATDASGVKLKSVSKSAAFASSLTIDDVTGIGLFAAAGDRVYYNIANADPRAIIVRDDGTGRVSRVASQWIGRVFATDLPIGRSAPVARMVSAFGFGTGGYAGGVLYSVDAPTADNELRLGILDNDVTAIAGDGIGNTLLLRGVAAGLGEIFSADSMVEDSLARVTMTGADETLLPLMASPE